MNFIDFVQFVKTRCMYETIYEDSDSNLILVIRMLDAYAMANKMVAAEREACAEVCKKHADVYEKLEQNPTAQSAWAACIDSRDAIRARGQA
jgi:hypothetical protein